MPVYVALGLIVMSASLGLRTAGHQLAHAPNVHVDRKKRAQTVPEVAAPDLALDEAQRFVGGSLFRKVLRVQDDDDDRRLAAEYPYALRSTSPSPLDLPLALICVSAQGEESGGDAQGRGRGRAAGDPAGEGGPPRQGLQEEPRLIHLGPACLIT